MLYVLQLRLHAVGMLVSVPGLCIVGQSKGFDFALQAFFWVYDLFEGTPTHMCNVGICSVSGSQQ